jgi:hypothetical protein
VKEQIFGGIRLWKTELRILMQKLVLGGEYDARVKSNGRK